MLSDALYIFSYLLSIPQFTVLTWSSSHSSQRSQFKTSSLLLVSVANPCIQLEPIAKSVWRNLSPSCELPRPVCSKFFACYLLKIMYYLTFGCSLPLFFSNPLSIPQFTVWAWSSTPIGIILKWLLCSLRANVHLLFCLVTLVKFWQHFARRKKSILFCWECSGMVKSFTLTWFPSHTDSNNMWPHLYSMEFIHLCVPIKDVTSANLCGESVS